MHVILIRHLAQAVRSVELERAELGDREGKQWDAQRSPLSWLFFHTSEHDRGSPQRSVSTVVSLPEATNDSLALVAAATCGVGKCWRDGYRYSKAGVVTTDLVPLERSQRVLIAALDRERGGAVMAAMDACNWRWGAVVPAAAEFAPRQK